MNKEIVENVTESKLQLQEQLKAEETRILDLFDWSNSDTLIYIPNEIFNDLNSISEFESVKVEFRHKAFAYSYYYLFSYLYRNSKFLHVFPMSELHMTNLMKFFKVSRNYYAYLSKKNGLLESIGYIENTTDFPIRYYFENGVLTFQMFSELDVEDRKQYEIPPAFSIKKPLKAFYRHEIVKKFDGTFYEHEDTHEISFRAFAKCMSVGKNGVELFYVYSYLKCYELYLNQLPSLHLNYLVKTLQSNEKKLRQCFRKLEELKLIKINHAYIYKYKILEII